MTVLTLSALAVRALEGCSIGGTPSTDSASAAITPSEDASVPASL
jgi:hypothetical protein